MKGGSYDIILTSRPPAQKGSCFVMSPSLAIGGGPTLRTRPFPEWPVSDDSDRERLRQVLDARVWSSDGPFERQFERAFAERHDALDAVAVANGTVSLLLCLRALGIRPSDEVIVPALTWTAAATCVIEANAVPVFADVDARTFCIDPTSVESRITRRTVAIMPVHLYSHMADMDAVQRIAERHHLAVIEDCAHAHGARWRGLSAGALGDMGSFSFQSSKVMTAGEGGAVISKERKYLDAVYSQKNCGRHRPERGAPVFGANHRMTEFQSALLLGQLARLDEQRKRRDRALERLRRLVAELPGISLLPPQPDVTERPQYRSSFAYDRPLAKGIPLPRFVEAVRAEGIPVERTYPVVYHNALYSVDGLTWYGGDRSALRANRCPQAERISESAGFTLAHPVLLGSDEDVDDVAKAMQKVLEHPQEAADLKSRLGATSRDLLRSFG